MTSTFPANGNDNGAARTLIPGAYERTTLTVRQPGAMGGAAYGSDHMPAGGSTMSSPTIAEREKEGGGGVSQRPSRPGSAQRSGWRRWWAPRSGSPLGGEQPTRVEVLASAP